MSTTFSQSRNSSGSSRLQLHQLSAVGSASRLRSSSLKKRPEPLHHAIADCLSSAAAATSHHGNPCVAVTEASRTLCDYLASPATIDLAYSVILEHTTAERERSPAVVARCVALLKRYLLQYKPSEETLLQIDRFCVCIIAECDMSPDRQLSPWSPSLNQQSVASAAFPNSLPSLPVSSFTSGALVKSLNYVRSVVAKYVPKRSFQAAAFAGAPSTSRQSLPSLSSLLSRSFNSQLSPANGGESSEMNDATTLPVSNLSNSEKVDAREYLNYLAIDVLKWRWVGEHPLSFLSAENGHAVDLQDMSIHNFLKLGAAALLVGDMGAKMKGQPWKYFGTADMPYLDQLLQPSSFTTITSSACARPHLRAITASKRSKSGPHQIWEDSPVSTFRTRARQLFQYRHYSEQQPLRLNPAEVCEVIAAVSSETYSPSANNFTVSSRLSNNSGKPSMDVAVSVLIKLVIDMYVLDSGTAAPLTLSMLEEMLSSPKAACRVRAFDLILNLGVHGHLLEPMMVDGTSAIEEEYSQEAFSETDDLLAAKENRKADSADMSGASSANDNFESWILNILYEIILLLVQSEEKEESVWASALSCLLYFVCDRGEILRNRLEGLDIRVIKTLIEVSRMNSWAELVHSRLVCMLTNMCYQVPDGPTHDVLKAPVFLIDQVDLIGGIEFILYELLENITEKLDTIIGSFTRLDKEFSHLMQITKSYKFLESIESAGIRNSVIMKAKLAWATLHSLLHSERIAYRQNGYTWLGDLLIAEISDGRDVSVWSNIKNMQHKIARAGVDDSSVASDVPLSIWLMCGLLKSKDYLIRWGFLYVLERLLMRCKILLDENEVQQLSSSNAGQEHVDNRLEKANAVIDIMSSALSLVAQRNETDRINILKVPFLDNYCIDILKMCDILFSQLCLAVSYGENTQQCKVYGGPAENKKIDAAERVSQQEKSPRNDFVEETDGRSSYNINGSLKCETTSMAAMLLRGQAIVPMQLVARVPAALFYWPLIQLAGAVADNISLGVAVGSKGRGNFPGAASDIRATLLLLLIGKCTADRSAFQEVGGEEFFRELLDDTDSRVAYYSSAFLLKRMMTEKPDEYQHMLQNLVFKAQQSNNEKLLENPYLQMRGILQLSNDGL
ncbi:uncharacterized protein LOC110639396 isoform X6 [Hevea brasiliensis]|uniref:uncharacterized protein LOC110639396 isoform X6 n=1 Tax=Hevea brasiliensis TaxID=3981 RepID=UPI0025FA432A|nr:uncharacterized protein LOC110639396 isoform X6 [Hevea brasiliensis]